MRAAGSRELLVVCTNSIYILYVDTLVSASIATMRERPEDTYRALGQETELLSFAVADARDRVATVI